MRRPRHVSAEERALWDQVASRANPLHPGGSKPVVQKSKPREKQRSRNAAISPFRVGEAIDHHSDHDLMPSLAQSLRSRPVEMDMKAFARMKRGKLKPQARLDLHGMTLAQAQPALVGFIMRNHSAGHRLVLVITGKGKARDEGGPIPTRFGVLRHQVPQWLSMAPLAPFILQVSEAHAKHGGGGAYYIYLRRKR